MLWLVLVLYNWRNDMDNFHFVFGLLPLLAGIFLKYFFRYVVTGTLMARPQWNGPKLHRVQRRLRRERLG